MTVSLQFATDLCQREAETAAHPAYAELMSVYAELGTALLEAGLELEETCGDLVGRLVVLGRSLERESDAAWAVFSRRGE